MGQKPLGIFVVSSKTSLDKLEVDLGACGGHFSWSNGKKGKDWILERLDRVVVCPTWLRRFRKAGVRHLLIVESDHAPVILECFMFDEKGFKYFRFYEAWSDEAECRKIVEEE